MRKETLGEDVGHHVGRRAVDEAQIAELHTLVGLNVNMLGALARVDVGDQVDGGLVVHIENDGDVDLGSHELEGRWRGNAGVRRELFKRESDVEQESSVEDSMAP